ncbi:hypothetical protein Tco_1148230 [Tanacetum coccineum]
MKRGFRGVPRPLLPAMLPVVAQNAGQADQAGTQSQPSSSTVPPPPTSQPAPTESTTIPPTPVTEPTSEPSSPSPAPEHETMEHPFEQPSPEHQPSSPRQESDIPQTQAPTHTHEAETGHLSVDDLFQLVPQLMTRIESLEKDLKQTKQTMRNEIVKLVKKVKKMEKVLKSRQVVLTYSEDEAAENSSKQGRNLQKDESKIFETPKQGKSLGEIDISPQGLEEAKTLAEALSQIKTKRRNVKTRVRRRLDAEDVSTGFEDVSIGFKNVSTGEDVSEADYAQRMVGLISQRRKLIVEQKAKAQRDKPMTQAQQRQYMATYLKNQGGWKLAQIKKLTDEELKEKFEYLMRSMERFVLIDTEKESRKRTGEELQTESSKNLKSDIREDVSVPKEKDKELKKKNQGGWKLAQIKKLTDEELKEKFEYNDEKHRKVLCLMDTGKRRKDKETRREKKEIDIKKPVLRILQEESLAKKDCRRSMHRKVPGTEEDVEAYMEERVDEPSSEEFPISSIPQGPTPAKIVKWQIIKTGKRGAYQIIREDNTYVVYVNFQGLLNDLTRDDLKELYRLMMLKYGDNRPEEEFERVLWGI